MSVDDGCWMLLTEMRDARHFVYGVDRATKPRHQALLKRVGLPVPTEQIIDKQGNKLKADVLKKLRAGEIKRGRERLEEQEL